MCSLLLMLALQGTAAPVVGSGIVVSCYRVGVNAHEQDPGPDVEAAMARWPSLHEFARRSHELSGPGAVLVERDALRSTPVEDELPMNYIAAGDVPAGDDFRPLMLRIEPHRQVMLILGGDGLDETVLVLERNQ